MDTRYASFISMTCSKAGMRSLWDIAFTAPDAGELELAGGMHPDGRLRIRGMEGYTYLVVRTVDGVMGDYQFMFYDTYNGAGDESERERARELIERAWGLI